MPVVLILSLIASGLGGAFVGSQIDDSVEKQSLPADTTLQTISPTKVAYYAAMGMGLFWLAHKSGVLKGK